MQRKPLHHFLLLICMALGTQSFATRYHVHATATGTGNGLSWTNAFTDI